MQEYLQQWMEGGGQIGEIRDYVRQLNAHTSQEVFSGGDMKCCKSSVVKLQKRALVAVGWHFHYVKGTLEQCKITRRNSGIFGL